MYIIYTYIYGRGEKGKSSNKMEVFNGRIIDNNALDVPGTRFGFTRAWFSSLQSLDLVGSEYEGI
jgi:hypothetical protein